MPKFQAPRGTRDLLPAERAVFLRLEEIARGLAARYGYQPIETPLFERFGRVRARRRRRHRRGREGALPGPGRPGRGRARALGAATRAHGRHRARLRPARHADVAAAGQADADRADVPLRPPAGRPLPAVLAVRRGGHRRCRARPSTPRSSSWPWPSSTASASPTCSVLLNSIGDERLPSGLHRGAARRTSASTRPTCPSWSAPASSTNPLRLLDSKDERMQPLIAPRRPSPRTCVPSAGPFRRAARAISTPCHRAAHRRRRLVRGLDYYTRTAFEFYRPGARRASSRRSAAAAATTAWWSCWAVQPTPGIGFGIGLDRVALALAEQGIGADARARGSRPSWSWAPTRRTPWSGSRSPRSCEAPAWPARADLTPRRLGKQLDGAAREGAHFAVICGDELEAVSVQVKDLEAGTQRQVDVDRPGPRAPARAGQHGTARRDDRDGAAAMTLILRDATEADRAGWTAFVASRPEGDLLQIVGLGQGRQRRARRALGQARRRRRWRPHQGRGTGAGPRHLLRTHHPLRSPRSVVGSRGARCRRGAGAPADGPEGPRPESTRHRAQARPTRVR